MEKLSPKPWIVKATIVVLGILAFSSLVACRSVADDVASQAIANVLRAFAANAAFIGIIVGSKLGRRVAIGFLALCAVGACFGIYIGARTFTTTPVLGGITLLLCFAFILWFYAYTFGETSRAYYRNLWAAKTSVAGA